MYNIVRLKHGMRLDNSCGCQIKSQFANCEVLFKKVTKENVYQFQKEVGRAMALKNHGLLNNEHRTLTNPKVLSDNSNFLSLPYHQLLGYYEDLLIGDIMVLEVLTINP